MKHYYLTVRAYMHKNKAQEDLQKFIQQYDNFLTDEESLEDMIIRITREIGSVNQKYPRCKDIKISKVGLPGEFLSFGFTTVDNSEIVSLNASEVKGIELSEDIEKSNRW